MYYLYLSQELTFMSDHWKILYEIKNQGNYSQRMYISMYVLSDVILMVALNFLSLFIILC